MSRNPLEYKLHIAILAHINSAFIGPHNPNLKCFHVPNQSRDGTEAFFNKQLGVLPGVSDMLFGWNGNHTGALEIKAEYNELSSAQNKFMSWAKIIGWHTGTAKTVKQAHEVLIKWGLKPAHNTIVEPDYRTKEEKFRDAHNFFAP